MAIGKTQRYRPNVRGVMFRSHYGTPCIHQPSWNIQIYLLEIDGVVSFSGNIIWVCKTLFRAHGTSNGYFQRKLNIDFCMINILSLYLYPRA